MSLMEEINGPAKEELQDVRARNAAHAALAQQAKLEQLRSGADESGNVSVDASRDAADLSHRIQITGEVPAITAGTERPEPTVTDQTPRVE